MTDLSAVLQQAPEHHLIRNTFIKMDKLLTFYSNPVCSVSGGSDSDIMIDLIEKVRGDRPVIYAFYNTGIEYAATLRHLDEIEQHYGIEIHRERAICPVPTGCKNYGVPFIAKKISLYIGRLQRHGFQWEDEPLEVLLARYPRCQSAIKWWCNAWGEKSRFNISCNKGLKEFIIANPPDFPISDKCCFGAKKNTAHAIDKKFDCHLKIIGERQREGGIRSFSHHTCFDINPNESIQSYRPLWFWTNEDKELYKSYYGIHYSDCYEKYGLTRTGCAGCPFNSKFEDELQIIERCEPKLYAAVNNIFGKSYDYMRRYRAFKEGIK